MPAFVPERVRDKERERERERERKVKLQLPDEELGPRGGNKTIIISNDTTITIMTKCCFDGGWPAGLCFK